MDLLKDTLRVFVVPTEILDAELDIYEKMVYMVLRSYANGQDDTAFPSYQTIAKKGSMSKRKAMDSVKKLVELGMVKKEERKKVSKKNGISQTSNLYTIYRPAEIQKKEVVHSMHYPGACCAPPLVHAVHQGSAQHAPEKNYLKELNLKELNKEEEEEKVSPSNLVSFLLSKDITIENARIFETRLLEEKVTGYTNDDVIESIQLSLTDFVNGVCNSPYKWAVGKLKNILDSKSKGTNKKALKKQNKAIKTEILPDWFNNEQPKQAIPAAELNNENQNQKKQEIEDMIQQLRG